MSAFTETGTTAGNYDRTIHKGEMPEYEKYIQNGGEPDDFMLYDYGYDLVVVSNG